MNISTHRTTNLIIGKPETRQHTPTSKSYQVVNFIAIDTKGNEVEFTVFSEDGELNIIETNDTYRAVRDVHRARKAKNDIHSTTGYGEL